MVKYIVKRLLLSIVILLGVSIIIYFLARLMPVDYLETKYSQQLTMGTITQEQVDQFKKDAGLYMPDGFLTVTIDDEGNPCNGMSFTKDVKSVNYNRVMENNMLPRELYWGSYNSSDGEYRLDIKKDTSSTGSGDEDAPASGQYTIYKRIDEDEVVSSGTFTTSPTSVFLSGLNISVNFSAEELMSNGWLTITVKYSDSESEEFRRQVSVNNYNAWQEGTMESEEFFTGVYLTHSERRSLTLEEGAYVITDLKGAAVPVTGCSGTYTIDENDSDGNGVYDLILNGINTQTIEYRQASVGDQISAVLGGYFSWLWNMMQGNFGRSFTHEMPVTQVISDHMWISFIISFIALIFEFIISIPLGITSATHQYSARDYTVTILTMIGISFPSFFFSALLIKAFATDPIKIFPSFGLVSGGSSATGIAQFADMAWHLVLPMVVMVVLSIGSLMRYTRTNMLEVLSSDYIRTARAKGLSEKRVVYVHAFRNTLIPLMTMMAGILPSLFGGAMITEEVFAIDGIGRIAYKALSQGDLPLIMGYNMFLAVLTVLGTLFSDIMYAVVDPRVKLTK